MSIRSFSRRKLFAVIALLGASIGTVAITGNNPVLAVSGTGGLISMGNGGQCNAATAIDANSANWNWTKPTLEYSTDGTNFTSAAGTNFGLKLCRDVGSSAGGMVQAYWFIIMRADGNDDMAGMPGIENTTFRVNIPLKSGDYTTRLTGYSEVVSLSEANNVATVVTKASGLAKVNWQGLTSFLTAHPECAGSTEQTWNQCKITKADRDIQYMVIQHLEYSTTALTSFQQVYKGTWIGANVNGYNMNLNCGSIGSDSSSGNNAGNYNGNNDGGANASSTRSLEVSVSGTPHLRADGVTINTGKLTAFIPGEVASKCFSDGTATLETIAKALSVTRTESSENGGVAQNLTAGTAFTAEAVTTPVAGILIKVPTMTFSNPTYKVSSALAPSSSSTTSMKSLKKGARSLLTSLIKPTSGAKVKWSVSGGCKISGLKLLAPSKTATCKLVLKQTITKTTSGKKTTSTTSKSVTIKVS